MSTSTTITTQFIRQLIEDLRTSINTGSYIGLGKSESWGTVGDTPTAASSTIRYSRETRGGLQHVKVLTGVNPGVTRQNWVANTIYPAYDDDVQSGIPYVMNDDYEVFLVIQQAVDANGDPVDSDVRPSKPTLTTPSPVAGENDFTTADTGAVTGYQWRYLFTLSQVDINRFLTNTLMPVDTFATDPEDGGVETEQFEIQTNCSVSGQILNIVVEDGGAGYSSPTATILGNGTGATATVNAVGGVIKSIRVTNAGQNYDFASIAIDDSVVPTSVADIRPVIGPPEGVEADPIEILGARKVIATTDFEDDELDTLFTENDFRQIVLLKDPKQYDGVTPFTGNTGKANRALRVVGSPVLLEDEIFTGQTSQAKGILDHVVADPDNPGDSLVYYHQTSATGFGTFLRGEICDQVGGGNFTCTGTASTTVAANQKDPDLDVYTGSLLYINNIEPVERDPNQTEDIKIVITY